MSGCSSGARRQEDSSGSPLREAPAVAPACARTQARRRSARRFRSRATDHAAHAERRPGGEAHAPGLVPLQDGGDQPV
jgi:hypothetical protein